MAFILSSLTLHMGDDTHTFHCQGPTRHRYHLELHQWLILFHSTAGNSSTCLPKGKETPWYFQWLTAIQHQWIRSKCVVMASDSNLSWRRDPPSQASTWVTAVFASRVLYIILMQTNCCIVSYFFELDDFKTSHWTHWLCRTCGITNFATIRWL